MSRFMLNLQAVDRRNRHHSSTFGGTENGHGEGNGSLFFQRVVGFMGSRVIDDDPLIGMESDNNEREYHGTARRTIAEENHDGVYSANVQPDAAAHGGMEEGLARDIQTTSVTA